MTLGNAGERDADWLAFGFDEKAMVAVMKEVLHATGKTIAERADVAQWTQTRPLQFAQQGTFDRNLVDALLPGRGETVETLKELLQNAAFTTITHATRTSSGSELTITYALSRAGADALRKLLNWDKARFEELARQLESEKTVLLGPVGIARKRPAPAR